MLAKKDISAQLNPEGLHLLLNFRHLPGNRSLFKDIQQLPAGTVLEWTTTSIQQHQPPETTQPHGETLDILAESVQPHLTSDVEVGAYLSGGIDSAAIVALSKQHQPTLRTFTLNVGDDPKEAEYAGRSATLLGVENIQGDISADLSQQLMRMTWHLETPKINALQASQLAPITSWHVKVSLRAGW